MKRRELSVINTIVIHCTATENPRQWNMKSLRALHTDSKEKPWKWGDYETHGKGWSEVGYHYAVTQEGEIENGRGIEFVGSGVRGKNVDTIHIALHGNGNFTDSQIDRAFQLINHLENRLDSKLKISGHYELDKYKTCPNYNMDVFRNSYAEKFEQLEIFDVKSIPLKEKPL